MSNDDIFMGYGVEVTLQEPEDFLKIMETLTRIGVASKKDNKLFQSCHILHKRGRYAIMHFKELFLLDGKTDKTEFSEQDLARRNKIASLLDEWKLVSLVNPEAVADPTIAMSQIKVIPFKEKNKWELVAKYNVGKKKEGS